MAKWLFPGLRANAHIVGSDFCVAVLFILLNSPYMPMNIVYLMSPSCDASSSWVLTATSLPLTSGGSARNTTSFFELLDLFRRASAKD